eukprot:5439703-Amphidinium_carterae.1
MPVRVRGEAVTVLFQIAGCSLPVQPLRLRDDKHGWVECSVSQQHLAREAVQHIAATPLSFCQCTLLHVYGTKHGALVTMFPWFLMPLRTATHTCWPSPEPSRVMAF